MKRKQVIALGGGGFLVQPGRHPLDDYVLAASRKRRPRICFIPTASGDNPDMIERFYRSFPPSRGVEASHLALFRMETRRDSIAAHLLAQDVIYVSGGNTANMLAVWRLHGVDRVLRRAWNSGIVLAGVSAGMICWFEDGVTDSYGRPLRGLGDGLGLLKGAACPHYDGEGDRRAAFHRLVQRRAKIGRAVCLAADDGCALHFVGTRLRDVVASRPGAHGYAVGIAASRVREMRLEAQLLKQA
ncbi:MAG: peptidase E [Phycisphaerales bacterium]|nr:peptidase E [Phycisphaerales bacterium]